MTPEQARQLSDVLAEWADNPKLTVQVQKSDINDDWADIDPPMEKTSYYFGYRIKPQEFVRYAVVTLDTVNCLCQTMLDAQEKSKCYYGSRIIKLVEAKE
jgi:hypothetical protein